MWRRTRRAHRLVALLLLATYSLSCSLGTWKPQQASAEQVLTTERPDHVRVITASGTKLELWNPRISNDSLVGNLKQVAAGETGPVDTARLVVDVRNTEWAEYMMGRLVGLHGAATRRWYDSVAAHPDLAAQLARMMTREIYLGVWVHVNGRWERRGTVTEAGPETWKRQAVLLDLAGISGDVRVRLESAPSLWLIDQVAMDYSSPAPLRVRELEPSRANSGRGGDVLPLLAAADRRELVLERGETAEVLFADPPAAPGMARSYMLASRGWYRLHVPESGAPQTAVLHRALSEPLAASRIITGDLMRAVRALDAW